MTTKYAVCGNCGRGIGITKNGYLKRHYKSKTKEICLKSGKHYLDKKNG